MDVAGPSPSRVTLFVAHPGHELRVFHWLESTQPRVHVLTDGSGRSGVSRLDYTSALLEQAGASRGELYGRFSDREVYRLLLAQHYQPFVECVRELAEDLTRQEIECVAGDATEGFNPSHDVCRLMIGAAITLAGSWLQRPIRTLAFPLHAAPQIAPPGYTGQPLHLELSPQALQRKLAAARDYQPLAGEVQNALTSFSADSFRHECLWPTDVADGLTGPAQGTPWYEEYATRLVQEGCYQQVIRFYPHIQELGQTLWHDVERMRAA